MTTSLTGFLTVLGLLAIAGVFYLLHRLRVRQRVVVVETTLFWRQALDATRAPVLTERFRHPWVYAFLVLIGALLWLAFAGLAATGDRNRHTLVLIDGSAAMARGDRFAAATTTAQALVDRLPRASRTVLLCADGPQTLLRAGEHERLLEARLAGRQPLACPASVEATIRQQAARARPGALRIYVAGDAVLDPAFVASLPADVSLERLAIGAVGDDANEGITALGVAPAASGAWDKVDLLVEVRRTDAAPVQAPALTLAGATLGRSPTVRTDTADGRTVAHFVYPDLPARGEVLEVRSAAGDANPIDDEATFVLPERRPRRVAIEPGLPAILTSVVRADPALQLVTDNPEIALRAGGSTFAGAVPAIEFVAESSQENAFLIQCRDDEDPRDVVLNLHDRLGLAEIDATDVARKMGKVIAMGAVQGEARGLRMWQSLLSPEFNFVQSRAFPLFLALAVRWIGGHWEPPATLAAGVPTDLADARVVDAAGRPSSSLGDAFTAPQAGVFSTDQGPRVAAMLLDPNTTAPPAAGADLATVEAAGFGMDLTTFLLLLALVLLGVEWTLFQKGRLP